MVVRAARPPPGLISHTPAHAGRTTETTRPMADRPAHESEVPGSPTDVVTCFLVRRDRGGIEVFVVRRSERVRTYRGHWGAISGYVEAGINPLDQAYTEMREETRLTRDEFRLVRRGAPLPVRDADHDLSWTVHPFLFETDVPDHVRTDWEAAEARWVDPAELLTLPTVPALAAAYALVDGR